MKKFIPLIWISLFTFFYSCSHKEVAVQEQDKELDKDSITNLLESSYFQVVDIKKIVGKDTSDFLTGSVYDNLANNIFLQFRSNFVVYYSGGSYSDNPYPSPAEAFFIPTKIAYPTNLQYTWDDAKGTMLFFSKGTFGQLSIDDNRKAYLDHTNIVLYKNLQEANDARVKPSIRVKTEDNDPKLGLVIYYFTLKPVYIYENDQFNSNAYHAVRF